MYWLAVLPDVWYPPGQIDISICLVRVKNKRIPDYEASRVFQIVTVIPLMGIILYPFR